MEQSLFDTPEVLRDILGIVKDEDLDLPTQADNWLIPGVVCTTNTVVYGQASAGKSMVISNIIASLFDGRNFFDIKPAQSGLKGLVICSDAKAEFEYKQRLHNINATGAVEYMADAGVISPEQWGLIVEAVRYIGYDYVIIDHATGVVDGDVIAREPWQRFWQDHVRSLNVPTIVVAHSSDSTFQGQVSHRPMGNSGVTQFSRCEVEVYTKGNIKFASEPLRELRSKSRYGQGVVRNFRIVDPGIIVEEEQAEESVSKQRASDTLDKNARIARLAVESKASTVTGVAEEIASEVGTTARTLSARKLPELVSIGLLVKNQNKTNGVYSPGPKLKI
ncbi:AAA family ATPase [Corynebacterium tuberculostearicum]|uniref:AAA family ATPase n=1 Tax=Corynebacterium tuberculostearicum TaxID=38304 RepID=UPI00254B733C|nr:AAA family ATPase [Corynebacterium tuberculostearicum]MDK8676457.1 AAA family ATPase [Corynebacterium tuberculostearicum]